MLDQFRHAIDSIPAGVVALAGPPAIWANMVWASPFMKTNRHGVAGFLALLSGALMAISVSGGDTPSSPIFLIGAAIAIAAMLAALFVPLAKTRKRKVR